MRKPQYKSQLRHSTEYVAITSQNSRGHTKQVKSENFLSSKEPKETWLYNIIWYPEWNSGTEKGKK